MSSFTKLLSRLTSLNEAKSSPMERIMPGFQTQARALAKSRGASSGTREGRLAMLGILFDLDIIDDSVVRMFKNDPSVSRMVAYFEDNGIASKIKSKRDDIQAHIKDQLENKVSFTTGNRTDAAQQRYEVNKLNDELKAAKKTARLERKKETAGAMSTMSQTVDMYDDLIGSMEASYSNEYMLEIVADRDSDLNDITQIAKYLSKFVDESDIEIEGRSIDVVFGASSKLGKVIAKMGIENVERSISQDLKSFGGAGVVIHEPDFDKKADMIGNLRYTTVEDEESYGAEDGESNDPYFNKLVRAMKQTAAAEGETVKIVEGEDEEGENELQSLGEVVDMKRVGRNALIGVLGAGLGAGLVKGVNYGVKNADKVSGAVQEIGSMAKLDSNKEFFSRLSDQEVAAVKEAMQSVRDASKSVSMYPNARSFKGSYQKAKSNLDQLIERLRTDKKIEPEVQFTFYENTNSTGMYLTEQVRSDEVRRSAPKQNLSFKEKYKPKTIQQLEELRRYGL